MKTFTRAISLACIAASVWAQVPAPGGNGGGSGGGSITINGTSGTSFTFTTGQTHSSTGPLRLPRLRTGPLS